jgi:hypothetical protein
MHRAPLNPERMMMQFHGGVYRSDDAGSTWASIAEGLPSDFGFPLVIDPRDPDSAYVIPLNADLDRVSTEGRLRVFETRDAGATWTARTDGLPQSDAYLTILRQAFGADARDPLGLWFGATSGEVYGSADAGATGARRRDLAPVLRSARPEESVGGCGLIARRWIARDAKEGTARPPSVRELGSQSSSSSPSPSDARSRPSVSASSGSSGSYAELDLGTVVPRGGSQSHSPTGSAFAGGPRMRSRSPSRVSLSMPPPFGSKTSTHRTRAGWPERVVAEAIG